MHEPRLLSRDEISRQVEIAKQLRAAFLREGVEGFTSSARAAGNRLRFAAAGKNIAARHAFAIGAAVLVGLGLKFYFFAPPVAEADVVRMDIATMQATTSPDMPRQELNDMAFGDSTGDPRSTQ
jgi:hypothetical protein